MKKILSIVLAMAMLVIPASAKELRGSLSGGILTDLIKIEGQDGFYIPIRVVAEKEGMTLSYDSKTNTVISNYLGNIMEFRKGESFFYYNREQVQEEDKGLSLKRTGQHSLPAPNKIIDGNMYVPSDFLATVYGKIEYDAEGFRSFESFIPNKSVILDKGISTEFNDKHIITITDFQNQKDILKRTLLFIDKDYAEERYEEINAYFNEDVETYYNNLEIVDMGEYVEVIIKK